MVFLLAIEAEILKKLDKINVVSRPGPKLESALFLIF